MVARVHRRASGYRPFVANNSDLVAVTAELHAALKPGDLAQTLRRVTDAAVELLPDVDGATITVEHKDGHFETAAATGSVTTGPEHAVGGGAASLELTADTAARLDHLQQVLEEGPAVDVTRSAGSHDPFLPRTDDPEALSEEGAPGPDAESVGEPIETLHNDLATGDHDIREPGQAHAVMTSDLSRDDRYPAYGAAAARAAVRAQAAVVLFETAKARGLLNLYSLRTGAFDDTVVLTDLFTHHSATALAYAAEHQERETTVAERQALGQALGIVMGRHTLSEANALALLQRTAEHRSVSVRLVAQELVASAEGAGSHE
jgi:hypothetical protein